jgi:lactoylglutathione lyase
MLPFVIETDHDERGAPMAATFIHTCYRILDPARSEDFYVNKLGMKKVGEMDLGSATNHFFALEEDPSSPMLELTHNHDQTDPYDKGNGYAHVAFTVDDLEATVEDLKGQGVTVTLEPKTLTADGNDYRIAFIEDPDGYKIELVQRGTMKVGSMYQ